MKSFLLLLVAFSISVSLPAQFVGINTSNPNVDLHIHGNSSANKRIQFTHATTGTTLLDGALIGISGGSDAFFLQNEAQHLWFGTSGNERMRITSSGLLGINKINPLYTLHVEDLNGNGVSVYGESANTANSSIYVNSLGANANAGFGYLRSGTLRAYTGVNLNNDWFMNLGATTGLLYAKSSNNFIGISTTTPSDKLHIVGNAGTDSKVRLEVPTTSGSMGFRARGNLGNTDVIEMVKFNSAVAGNFAGVPVASLGLLYTGTAGGRMLLDVMSNNEMLFATNNTVRLTIDGAGEIGIGTLSPSANLHLLGNNDADSKIKLETQGTTGSAGFQARTNSGADDVFEMVKFNTNASGSIATVPINNLSLLYTGQHAGRMLFDIVTSNEMFFATNNTLRLTIDGAGNIGMGTPIPTERMHLLGYSNTDTRFRMEAPGTTGSVSHVLKTNNGPNDIFEMVKFNIASPGVLAGVPLAQLSLLYSGIHGNAMMIDVMSFNPMHFATNNTVRMIIDAAGLVGINNLSPTRQLDVNGNARIGINGTTITSIIKTIINADIPSIPAGLTVNQTFSVPNAATGATAIVSPSAYPGNGIILAYARVSAPGVVEAAFYNATANPVNPAPMNFSITVIE